MSLSGPQKRKLTANAARDKAEALLERLEHIQVESERCSRANPTLPARRRGATRDALEKAIASTRELIKRMNDEI